MYETPEGKLPAEIRATVRALVNPIAMTFDQRGRIWVTESLEYPRKEAGPGRDRIKILEDTKGNGRFDKVTVFAEGLNIPTGVAVGLLAFRFDDDTGGHRENLALLGSLHKRHQPEHVRAEVVHKVAVACLDCVGHVCVLAPFHGASRAAVIARR